jgi:DNA gyrase inhibitor GyrI
MDKNLEVTLIELPPMRVASFNAYSSSPEHDAYRKMLARGVLTYPENQRIFGFNNPGPSPGSPNYGYEFWLTVGPEVSGDDEVQIKEVPAGTYAVLHCESLAVIGERWQQLVHWREASPYRLGPEQCLEEHLGPIFSQDGEPLALDLLLAVRR